MTSPAPASSSSSSKPQRGGYKGGRGGRGGSTSNFRTQLNHTYRFPLPTLLPTTAAAPAAADPTSSTSSATVAALGSHAQSGFMPDVVGVWDELTGSVWVTDPAGVLALWTRGNFGKGSLSRSEPTYLKRRVAELTNASNTLSPEEVTALRRQERKQFKIARALHAVATVEAAERAFLAAASSAANAEEEEAANEMTLEELEAARPKRPANGMLAAPASDAKGKARELAGEVKEDEIVNLEHLQVLPEEVWFLAWALGCLSVYMPNESEPLSLKALFALLASRSTFGAPLPATPADPAPRPDNPLLISYAAYHHYRSLGWVVRPGVKFCVDWLLYKRGVVFSHAEFAVVLIPVYSNPADKESSPYELDNSGPLDWAWLSTLNRVNSQVKKTLVLTYVTIPPLSLGGRDSWFCGGAAESWAQYDVREVVLRRFVPARMRD